MNSVLPPLISFALCFLLLRWLLRGRLAQSLLDHPNYRSLHSTPTPRIGGIGVLAGIIAGGVLVGELPPLLFAILLLLGGFCFLDDRRGLSSGVRLAVHLLVAAAWVTAAPQLHPGPSFDATSVAAIVHWSMLIGLVLALAWMMNLYNFMDGANGLAGGMAVFGFGAYGVAASLGGQPELATLAFVVVAAASAFLAYNFDPARIFLGDLGSVPLGFLAGALGLWGWQAGAWPTWFPLLVFSVFGVDATATLLRRARRGEKVWLAHREHYYQRLIQSGWSHRHLALAAYSLMLLSAGSACLLLAAPRIVQALLLLAWGISYLLLLRSIDRRLSRSATTQ